MGTEYERVREPVSEPVRAKAPTAPRPAARVRRPDAPVVAQQRAGAHRTADGGSAGLTDLQRKAGNRAVQRMLQRETPAPRPRPPDVDLLVQRMHAGAPRVSPPGSSRLARPAPRPTVVRPPAVEIQRDLTEPPAKTPDPPAPTATPTGDKSATPASGTPPTAEPTVEITAGASVDIVSAASKVPNWTDLKSRLTARKLDDADMLERCAEYVLAITAPKPQMAKVKYLLGLINGRLQGAGAFDHKAGDDPKTDYSNKFNLWSGVKDQAADYADATGGVALETSAAGSLFDGLNFGMKWNDALTHQWNELSRLYAEGIRGEVHIHQYRGVRGGSVFNKVEYPTIKDSIDIGTIEPVIHLYANWGRFTGMVWGCPTYGGGDKGRREEKIVKGKSALNTFMGAKWEFSDGVEKQGGYWPAGKGGGTIDAPDGSKVREGEEW